MPEIEEFITILFQVGLNRPPTLAELAENLAYAGTERKVQTMVNRIVALPELRARWKRYFDAIENPPAPVPVPPIQAPTPPPAPAVPSPPYLMPLGGPTFQTYTFAFSSVQGDAIRIYGVPGGVNAFISVGELEVYGPAGNLSKLGSIIARVPVPTGSGGNPNLEVIRDGDKPPVGTTSSLRQYDTYDGENVASEDWIGYQYPSLQTFSRVVFQEGKHFVDGGWFTSLTVQVRQGGVWTPVTGLVVTPPALPSPITPPVPVPPPVVVPPPVGATVAYYQGVYDAEYQKHKPAIDAMAASGVGQTYYYLQYILTGTLSMYEAAQNTKYLDQALAWVETMISKATVIDSSGKKNWSGPEIIYVAAGTSYQLTDLQGSTELARLARIILTTPTLTSAYKSRATAIYNFVRDHIVNKWLFTRSSLYWFEDQESTQTEHSFRDKVALLIRILVHLTASSTALGGADNTTFGYPSSLLKMAQGFFNHQGGAPRFTPFKGGLIWDNGLGDYGPIPPNDPTTAVDTSHGNRYPYAMVDCYKAGIVFTLPHVLGVAKLLTATIWNQSLTSPAFTNFISGADLPVPGRPPGGIGNIYFGWNVLAEYDPQVLLVMDATLKAILAGTRNASLDVTNSMYGRIGLSGHLAKAVAGT